MEGQGPAALLLIAGSTPDFSLTNRQNRGMASGPYLPQNDIAYPRWDASPMCLRIGEPRFEASRSSNRVWSSPVIATTRELRPPQQGVCLVYLSHQHRY